MIYETQKNAQQACREWQERLFLRDWDIKTQIVRRTQLVDGDGMGEVRYKHGKRMAIINLLDPVDYESEMLWPQDHEVTLVHELLHLHFVEFEAEEGTTQDNAQERAIDSISKALVGLRRSGK